MIFFKTRLKGVTLLEVIIAMIISSVVVSFTFFSYRIVIKQFQNVKVSNENSLTLETLYSLLNSDIYAADLVFYSSDQLTINKSNQKVIYSFDSDNIIREQASVKDTFPLKAFNVNTIDLEQELEGGRPLTSISFILKGPKDTVSCQFKKDYDPEKLFYFYQLKDQ